MAGPLEGVRVLELTQVFVGPYCGLNLADLGADVVKVEPPEGDSVRFTSGHVVPNENKAFHAFNRGKRGIVLDLKRPEAQTVLHRLIPDFDVFVINSRPGVPARLQVDYETLTKFRPDLIYQEITGFGYELPGRDWAGSDIIAQAYAGIITAEGKLDAGGAPEEVRSTPFVDYATGLAAAMGICAALYRRGVTGQGEYLHATLFGAALAFQGSRVSRLEVSDALFERPMMDELHAAQAAGASYPELLAIRQTTGPRAKVFRMFYGGYRTKGGAIILGAVTGPNQQTFRNVLGITDDPGTEPGYDPNDPVTDARLDAIRVRVQELLLTKTAEEWMEIFVAAGAPASTANFPEDMADDVQVRAMGAMLDIEHPITGPERMVGPIVQARHSPTGTTRPSPPLGYHTEEVLLEGGIGADEIAALRASGALGYQ